ncbi:unnamed protein product [Polarella glacialis]|uniref:Uncharacterized protein n=1 Tax=Polarella glacialis TaxID=89957 RepID=A0A813E8T9_POLGL|nr:unnamed protein product [Polarella glacialis]
MLAAMLRAVTPNIHFVPKENIQYWAAGFSAAGPQFFDLTGFIDAPATESLVVSASQRRRQQRSRLAQICAEEKESAHTSPPKVSRAAQTVGNLPGPQFQCASQSCQASVTCAASRAHDWSVFRLHRSLVLRHLTRGLTC